jgi:hypothetical protein
VCSQLLEQKTSVLKNCDLRFCDGVVGIGIGCDTGGRLDVDEGFSFEEQ